MGADSTQARHPQLLFRVPEPLLCAPPANSEAEAQSERRPCPRSHRTFSKWLRLDLRPSHFAQPHLECSRASRNVCPKKVGPFSDLMLLPPASMQVPHKRSQNERPKHPSGLQETHFVAVGEWGRPCWLPGPQAPADGQHLTRLCRLSPHSTSCWAPCWPARAHRPGCGGSG